MRMALQLKMFFLPKQATLPIQQQYKFLLRLDRLLNHGYTISYALEILQWDHQWIESASTISNYLEQGKPLNEALLYAKFDKKVVSFMYFAMAHGDLKAALKQCCTMLKQQIEFISKFKQVSRYPIVLFFIFMILLYFVKTSVYPSFLQLFASTQASSQLGVISMYTIDFVYHSIIVVFITSLCLLVYVIRIGPKMDAQQKIALYEKVPIVRTYQKLHITFLFALHLSSLLTAGISLKESLHMLKNNPDLVIISYYATLIIEELHEGKHLSSILSSFSMVEKELSSIFQKNANHEDLIKDLTFYASFLVERMEERTKRWISLLQPVFFVVMAGLIIFIYLSLMLPMFELIQTI
ncbi:type II secretion system F family protein [Aquibacillus koreensis]|uniref:Type II secretion system F family protein n=1 Tax=Aquibacillus koreensis TaxID=279446 RepID=A0A9X3WHB8_9BACI|nr:competence type IV pilus assembly protein ComGB [Aquibacillus koreensis]MCT2537547.1 competence type IV pilus assembly protein ComGB [Aquibacillus koreensis]MDC3418993.1 type II secretion system F family protein [Aquibacillus koreensis]